MLWALLLGAGGSGGPDVDVCCVRVSRLLGEHTVLCQIRLGGLLKVGYVRTRLTQLN